MKRKFLWSMEHRPGSSQITSKSVLPSTTIAFLTIVLCSALFSASANASCGKPADRKSLLALSQKGLFQPAEAMQVAATKSAEGEENEDSDSIVGFWHISFLLPDGTVFDEGYDQFHGDGLEILNDNPAPGAPNGSGDVCLGVFKEIEPRTYKLKHPFWNYDEKGNLIGTGVILEKLIVDDRSTFHGSFVFITYDLKGVEQSREQGVLKGERITVD